MAIRMLGIPTKQPNGKVIVVGGVSIDLVAFSERAPETGETVIGDDFKLVLGGKGSNQAIAAALAGSSSLLVSCIGDDLFSEFATQSLTEFGVHTNFLKAVEGPTGIAHIRVGGTGENNIVVIPLANSKIQIEQIDEAFSKNPDIDVLLLQLEIPWYLNQHAMKLAKAAGVIIILDPAPAMQLAESTWAQVDLVTPNESEAKSLTGVEVVDANSASAAGKWFLDRGVKVALITAGAEGVYCVSEKGLTHFPPLKVNALDTTAAGDAFAGYLGALISQGASLDEAIRQAVIAASISVTRVGASSSLPSKAELETFDL